MNTHALRMGPSRWNRNNERGSSSRFLEACERRTGARGGKSTRQSFSRSVRCRKKKKNARGLSVSRSCRFEIRVVRASPRLNGGIARDAATRSSPDARLSEPESRGTRLERVRRLERARVAATRVRGRARMSHFRIPVGSSVRRREDGESCQRRRHVAGTHFFVSAHPVSSSSSGSVSRETRPSYCSFAVTGRSSYRSSSSRLRGASVGSLAVSRKRLASIPHSLSVTSLPGPLSPSSGGSRTSYRGSDRRLERNEPAGRASYRGMEPAAAPRALSCVRDEKTSKKKSTA